MLSIETESELAKIFLTLAEGEKSIDINRQILVELEDFDPFQVFTYLDTNQKNYLNCSDLLNYFTERGIITNELEISLIMLFYDMDYDGVLSYPEFAYFIQSDYGKKGLISQNENNSSNSNNNININLSPSIEQALTQLFSNECDLAKKIIELLSDLKQRFDFNIHDLYHTVKNYNFIEENSLRNFFERNKISFLESDIRKIMKRLDFNGDGKIDFCEFHAFLGFPDCQLCCPIEECKCCGLCCCNFCLCDVPCFVHNCIHGKIMHQNQKIINEKNINKIEKEVNIIEQKNIEINTSESNENKKNNNEIKINKNNLNLNNYNKNKTNMENLNSNLEETENYNFNYNGDLHQMEESNSYVGHVSDNLILRLSPQRKYNPGPCHFNHYHTNQCIQNDYCCDIQTQIPCEKCIHNHFLFCQGESKKEKLNNSNYINNKCEPCEICNNFPCCCCSICHYYPCKCCPKCHSLNCKCCLRCNNFPCKCCPRCKSPSCKCCPNCKTFPCKCCPGCHLKECICCKVCHQYPCKCCPQCHFNICKCCKVCHQYPCACCQVCHMAQCVCCENCENYPCRCCPDCHCVECQCCINCGTYPCKCGYLSHIPNHVPCDLNCNCNCNCCCQMCGNVICEDCLSNPCRCCPLCHEDKCGCKKCEHEKEFLKTNIDNIKCPLHNAHSMKHNPGCPFEVKCPHEPKCSHKSNNNRNNNSNNNSSYNNSPNNMNNRNNKMFSNTHGRNNNYCPHNHNNMNNNSFSYNNSVHNMSFNQRQNKRINQNMNMPFNNNNSQNSNEENNEAYNDNEENLNLNEQYKQNNNNQFNQENEQNNYSDNQNYEEENDDENNINNDYSQNNDGRPVSPLSSPFPPDSPYFNINEPGQKSNWIFCPKCNVYHRCPHPGCDHNPNIRTTTHKCIHEDESNNINQNNCIKFNNNINNNSSNNQNSVATPNFNNNNSKQNVMFPKNNSVSFNPNQNINNKSNNINNSNNQINMSQSNKSISSRKRGVFSSCPYQEELGQFVDFLALLMEVESKIEDMKIHLAQKADFNFEDIFRMFEADGKGYIEAEDLKQGLKLLGLNPSEIDIKLLMKRFDLNQQNLLSYTDFFDMVVSFEKKTRNNVQIRPPNSCCPCKSPDIFECDTLIAIKNLFKFIIECENEINQRRAGFDSLRSKYSEVVKFLDYSKRGVINRSDLKLYLTQFNKFTTSKECDLLFIRLDRTRTGEVSINEIENELMFLR